MDDRRQFIQSILHSTFELYEAVKGSPPKFKLSDITRFDDETLGRVIPKIRADHLQLQENGRLCVYDKESEKLQLLYIMPPEEIVAFEYFDGEKDINSIAEQLGEELNIPPKEAFRYVQSLFNNLTNLNICFPKNMV